MRLSFHDQSPNTVAAIVGAAFVASVLLYPRGHAGTRPGFWLLWAVGAGALCLTQSRGAGLALAALGAVWGIRAVSRPAGRLAAVVFLGTSLAIWTWAGMHGRVAAASLGNSAGMRADFAKAALIRAAETRLHGMAPDPDFAEDAALRYGIPVSLEQRKIIRNPLSSLLNLAAGPGVVALLAWVAWLAPALCLVLVSFPVSRLRGGPSGPGGAPETPGAWTIPSICFFAVICALFNDLHQNIAGRWCMWACAWAGAAWLGLCLVRARFRLLGAGVAGAATLLLILLAAGEWWLRDNFSRQGIRRWVIQERPISGGASLRMIEGGIPPEGTLVLFNHGGRGELSWAARQTAYRLVGQGWRLIEVEGGREVGREIREACLPDAPLITLGVEGPAPAAFARAMRPVAIVSVAPSRLVVVSDDGGGATSRRHWLFTDEAESREARRLLGRGLAAAESDTEIVVLGPDLSASMKSSLGRVAENHRRAACQSRNSLTPASFP